jgi:hypothetical protein
VLVLVIVIGTLAGSIHPMTYGETFLLLLEKPKAS